MARAAAFAAFRSVLVALDHSPAAARLLARVGRLPLAAAARVSLLHVVPDDLPSTLVARAERDGARALDAAARALRRALAAGAVVETAVHVGQPAALITRHAGRVAADLVVIGRGARRLRDELLGSTAERVVRQARVPVLTVRRSARTAYRRPLLAVDTDQAAASVLAAALRVVGIPRPRFAVVHAYDPPFHGLFCSTERQADEIHGHYREQAARDLAGVIAAGPEPDLDWRAYVRAGTPRTVIPKLVERLHADVLVLGTRGRVGLAYAFLGTVAGDVLRDVSCDVLVVPPRRG